MQREIEERRQQLLEIVGEVMKDLKDDDLLIMMSNGGFDGLKDKLIEKL